MKKKKQKSAYSSSSTQNKTKSNKLKTGLVIGGVSLAVLALAGGLSAFFIGNNKNDNKTPIDTGSSVTDKIDFAEYNLPDEFNFATYSVYKISDKFDLFSSSDIGTYILNEETKNIEFFRSSRISATYDEVINGFKYFWFSDNTLIRFNVETGESENVMLNSGVSFNTIRFVGHEDNLLYVAGHTSGSPSDYYFVVFDIETNTSEVFELTSAQYNSARRLVDLGDYYYLGYDVINDSSYTGNSILINKTTKEVKIVSGGTLAGKYYDYILRENKLYGIFRDSSTSTGAGFLGSLDLSTATLTEIKSAGYSGCAITGLENGLVVYYPSNSNTGSMTWSTKPYYMKYSDETITDIYLGSSSSSIGVYNVNGKLLFSPNSSNNSNYACLAEFNEETLTLDKVYTESVASGSGDYVYIKKLNDKYYAYSGSSVVNYRYAEIEFLENGDINFKSISLRGSTSIDYKIKDNVYLFESSGLITYYDFATDTYRSLKSLGSGDSIEEIQIEDNLVYIYASDNMKYELNLDTITFKAVAYWE